MIHVTNTCQLKLDIASHFKKEIDLIQIWLWQLDTVTFNNAYLLLTTNQEKSDHGPFINLISLCSKLDICMLEFSCAINSACLNLEPKLEHLLFSIQVNCSENVWLS